MIAVFTMGRSTAARSVGMMALKPPRTAWVARAALAGLALATTSGAAGDDGAATARLESMRDVARGVTIVEPRSDARAELVPEPIYRFDDPARVFGDGTIWAFGPAGRPAAILCLSLARNEGGETSRWIHELTTLAPGPLAGSSQHASGRWMWNPRRPEVGFQPVPGAPRPSDAEGKRLLQIKEVARRFKASESLDPARNDPSDRFELRLLPQPIYRYRDPEHGLIDGAIFLLSYGRNPEIMILIEARREEGREPAFSYSLARLGAARFRVSCDDREVADLPKPVDAGWRNPYFLFDRRALGLKE